VCACEALDFQAVVEAMEATKSTTSVGAAKAAKAAKAVEAEEKAASKCCAGKLSPLAVCAHTAINDPVAGTRIMRLLLAAGADPNAQCDMGLTPLHWASTPEGAWTLIANGADPRIRDTKGRTALEYHRELEALGVARVIAAYERTVQVSSATLERSASRKIKRDASSERAVSPDSREEKAKRARTVA